VGKLSQLALKYGSGKGPQDKNYTEAYGKLFEPFKDKKINIFEIGIGDNCASVKMWVVF